MKDFRLSDMRLFAKVAELGGLTAAADALHIPKASASRQLQRLEATVGHVLLRRGAAPFALTEEGREFLAAARHVLTVLDDAMLSLSSGGDAVVGRLRLAVPHYYGIDLLALHLPEFMSAHPQLEVVVETGNDRADLLRDEADVAIRRGREGCDELVARHLMSEAMVLCAAPDYLAARPALAGVPDLALHALLVSETEGRKKEFSLQTAAKTCRVNAASIFRSADLELLLKLALAAKGIGLLPLSLVKSHIDRGALAVVLPMVELKPQDINLVYLPSRRHSPKIKMFVDYVLNTIFAPS